MKNTIVFVLLSVMLLVVSCGEINIHDNYSYIEGYYLLSSNGTHMIVLDSQGPCIISGTDGVTFNGLTNGDLIKIKTNGILESYPGHVTACSLEKLSDGERGDIDAQTLKQLAELGWIEAE